MCSLKHKYQYESCPYMFRETPVSFIDKIYDSFQRIDPSLENLLHLKALRRAFVAQFSLQRIFTPSYWQLSEIIR